METALGIVIEVFEAASVEQDIKNALRKVGASDDEAEAGCKAIDLWKQAEQGLTWKNLKSSVTAKKGSPHKILGFGPKTRDAISLVGNNDTVEI